MVINKPRYTGIPWELRYLTPKQHWHANHISFAGYLACSYSGGFRDAWDLIMSRYVRMKHFVLPDEFNEFGALFLEKHPEFSGSHRLHNDIVKYSEWGAVYVGHYHIQKLYGYRGLLKTKQINATKSEKVRKNIARQIAKTIEKNKREDQIFEKKHEHFSE